MKILVLVLLFILKINIFPGTLIVYDNVNLKQKDLDFINSVSREAFLKINQFFYGKGRHSDLSIDLFIQTREKIESIENIRLSDSILGLAIPSNNRIYLIYPFRNITNYPYNSLPSLIYHEIFHLVLDDYLGSAVVPLWLNEGTAMHLSREFIGEKFLLLSWATTFNRLIPLYKLTYSFPEDLTTLSYIQSHHAVAYIVEKNGETSLQILFERIRRTGNFESAFIETYGKSSLDFSKDWEEHVKKEYNFLTFILQRNVLWAIFAFILIILLPIKKYLSKKKMEKWKEDEEPDLESD